LTGDLLCQRRSGIDEFALDAFVDGVTYLAVRVTSLLIRAGRF
jgi:hypothetical protein